jgi:hypothetical protein
MTNNVSTTNMLIVMDLKIVKMVAMRKIAIVSYQKENFYVIHWINALTKANFVIKSKIAQMEVMRALYVKKIDVRI